MASQNIGYSERLHDYLATRNVFLSSTGAYRKASRLVVATSARMEPFSGIYAGSALCSIGSFSYCRSGVKPGMTIGRYCSIANGLLMGGTRHPIEWATSSNISYERQGVLVKAFLAESGADAIPQRKNPGNSKHMPRIGNDVWIAQNVTINDGVTIGDGAVIAAGAVVTRDVEPYTIVGGNKAQTIRKRFRDDQVDALLDLRWWDYDPKTILNLDITNIDHFIDELSSIRADVKRYSPKATTGTEICNMVGSSDL